MTLLNIKTNKKLLALSAAIAFSTFATNSYALEINATSGYSAGSGANATSSSNSQSLNTDTSTATSVSSYSNGYSIDGDSNSSGSAFGNTNGSFFARAKGSGVAYSSNSSITYSQSFTNNAASAQDFSLNFEIIQGALSVFGTPTATNDFANASYNIYINLLSNGTTTSLFTSYAELSMNNTGGLNLTRTGTSLNTFYDATNPNGSYGWSNFTQYNGDPGNESLAIGTFAANESFSIQYGMTASANGQFTPSTAATTTTTISSIINGSISECGDGGCGRTPNGGSSSRTGDPFNINGVVIGAVSQAPSSVPEASSILLMGLGLVGLAFGRRKA